MAMAVLKKRPRWMRLSNAPHQILCIQMPHWHIPYFDIFYSTTFLILNIILLILLAVTPADHIYQTLDNNRLGDVFVVGSIYIFTALVAAFTYASRLFTNRSVLTAIPKSYIPIEEGEIGTGIRRMIVRNRQRSALIAWDSRPRDLSDEYGDAAVAAAQSQEYFSSDELGAKLTSSKITRELSSPQRDKQHVHSHNLANLLHRSSLPSVLIPISPHSPPWGRVTHPGWSGSSSVDFPNLQFETVIHEFPNLLEAKAVSLAPRIQFEPDQSGPEAYAFLAQYTSSQFPTVPAPPPPDPEPDPQAVAALQRPQVMGLREYMTRLQSLGLIEPPELGERFLDLYEYARFSAHAILEEEFRELTELFSDLLAGMTNIDTDALAELQLELEEQFQLLEYDESLALDLDLAQNTTQDYPTPTRTHSATSNRRRQSARYSSTARPSSSAASTTSTSSVIRGDATSRPARQTQYQHQQTTPRPSAQRTRSQASLASSISVSTSRSGGSVVRHSVGGRS